MARIEHIPHVNATVSASGTGPTLDLRGSQKRSFELLISNSAAATGTSPTLTFKAQTSADGITFADIGGSSIQLVQAAGFQRVIVSNVQANYLRSAWVIGGTAGPTFTGVNSRLTGLDC